MRDDLMRFQSGIVIRRVSIGHQRDLVAALECGSHRGVDAILGLHAAHRQMTDAGCLQLRGQSRFLKRIAMALDRHVIAGMWRQGGVKCKPRCILGQDIARPAIMLHKKDRPALSARVLDQKPNPLDHGLALVWRAVGKGEHALLHVNHH